eukprot:CAMPEP_0170624952 /NCGR_PEP_ID=MMETSP0224-20130122/30506_1 /TAXON_ID=285029 /ORGANISM="Togula jolla, Strain CCCM 725" /LENGTH=398 /DNA_ID=CAMNT_0010951507 /DNA_START=574 /DNA_END=1770 /DNA_ORIENTATION=-
MTTPTTTPTTATTTLTPTSTVSTASTAVSTTTTMMRSDDHGDSLRNATTIVPRQDVLGSIEVDGDWDWFTFDLRFGRSWAVEIRATGEHEMRVYENTGINGSPRRVSTRDSAWISREGFHLSWYPIRVRAPTTYWVAVRSSTSSPVDYTLRLHTSGPPDDHGNSFDLATPISVDEEVVGSLEVFPDVDYFAIPLEAGLWQFKSESDRWLWMEIYLKHDDGVPPERVTYTLSGPFVPGVPGEPGVFIMQLGLLVSEPATYYVTFFLGTSAPGDYNLRVQSVVDEHSNSRELATPIQVGEEVSSSIEWPFDADWFSISIEEGWWRFELRPGSGAILEIFNASARVALNMMVYYKIIDFECPPGQAGKYDVRVSDWLKRVGNYTLVVTPGTDPSSTDDVAS